MKIIIHTISFLLSFSIGFTQNTYFVAMQGDNANPGTFDQPWQTIQYAVDQAADGDSILIKNGTYPEQISITHSGTKDNSITIQNFENDIVKIDATNHAFGIILKGVNYINISNLEVFGATVEHYSQEPCGVYLQNDCSHILIQNCNIHHNNYGIINQKYQTISKANHIAIINSAIHDNQSSGIDLSGREAGSCDHLVISGNDIYSNGYENDDPEWDGAGIKIRASDSIIEDNDIYENAGNGLLMRKYYVDKHHNMVKKNHFYGNRYNGIMIIEDQYSLIYENEIYDNGAARPGGGLHGIYMAQTDYCIIYKNKIYNHINGSAVRLEGDYNVIRDNNFYSNGCGMISTDRYGPRCYGNIVRNNLIYEGAIHPNGWPPGSGMEADGTDEIHLYNNVFFNNPGYGLAFFEGDYSTSSDMKIKNNIFMNTGWEHICIKKGNEIGYSENYNDIYPDKADAFSFINIDYRLDEYKKAVKQGLNTISKDPLFVAANDFHLSVTSPCIDAGGFLTHTVGSGSGTQIPVQDALWFCDGYGLVEGDLIQLEGQTETAQITQIDYDNHIITIERPLTWTMNQGVSLPYYGIAPDMGCFEHTSVNTLSASIHLSDSSPVKSGNIVVTLTTSKPVIKVPTPLFFMENDATISTIDLSGNTPGNNFMGIFVVDSTVANGKGYFYLAEGALEDKDGNKSNLIASDVQIVIDQIAPSKPENVEVTVIK